MLSEEFSPLSAMSKKSVQAVSKQIDAELAPEEEKLRSVGKTDSRYWKPRLFRNGYTRDGAKRETTHWCIKIAHQGKRETINLRTPNQATAAQRAADLYKLLVGDGWEAVLEKYKPKPAAGGDIKTVGDFIAAAMAVSSARPLTLWDYAKAFRRIMADVSGVGRGDLSRYDGRCGGAEKWRERVDAVALSVLTPEKLQSWRLARLKAAGTNPAAQRAAKTTINSLIRQAKSLFSPKVLKFLPALDLPVQPFADVQFFERSSMRYDSKVDASELIEAARAELEAVPENLEQWKVFVLLLFAGLRRNEVDKLRWDAVDFMAGVLRIEDHEDFQAKCESSKGSVELDAEVVAMLRRWRANDPRGVFVLQSSLKVRSSARFSFYRCERSFKALSVWLRSKGITARKALHELRKEAGSVVAHRHGIYAASRFLRHADITITSQHYLDKKERVTLGLGSLLTPIKSAKVIAFAEPEIDRKQA